METLMDSVTGSYEVRTEASTYLIDLDRRVLRRLPRTGNTSGALLRRDDELITLLELIECTVGRSMAVVENARVDTQQRHLTMIAATGVGVEMIARREAWAV